MIDDGDGNDNDGVDEDDHNICEFTYILTSVMMMTTMMMLIGRSNVNS